MLIRNASEKDAEAIAEIYRHDLGYDTDRDLIAQRLNNLNRSREAVFVAELEGEVIGALHIEKFETLYFKPIANILSLAVSEEHRREGAGKTLVSKAEDWARENKLESVRLESAYHRKSAHEFYRALGFDSEKNQIRFLKNLI